METSRDTTLAAASERPKPTPRASRQRGDAVSDQTHRVSTDAPGVSVNDVRENENENEAVSEVERSVAGEENKQRKKKQVKVCPGNRQVRSGTHRRDSQGRQVRCEEMVRKVCTRMW